MKRIALLVSNLFFLFAIVLPGVCADTTRPTVSITSPTANLRISNELFTVLGKAGDHVGVSNVFVSVNKGTWTNATSSNNWTNWSAQVTLTPGTNAVSAYAQDTSGNCSATNTVKCFYVVKTVLTVLTDSNLTVTPNYNGQSLEIGATYSMTAKATNIVKGFGPQKWTDGSNNLVTNSPTLKFLMASNLTFVAHYGDNTRPLLPIPTSSANSNVVNSVIYHGTASDNVGVAGVYYQLNGNSILPADTTNSWTNWNFTLFNIPPGQSTLRIFAVDTSSNASANMVINVQNNTAPTSLSGRLARVVPSDESGFTFGFGNGKFNQAADDTNHVNGVGSFSYLAAGGAALLKVKFTSPPTATNEGTHNIFLTFYNPTNAVYTYTNILATNYAVIDTNTSPATTNYFPTNMPVLKTGQMFFSPAPKLAPASMNNQLVFTAGNDATNGYGTFFQSGKFTASSFTGQDTNKGSYTYAAYSPVAGLFKLTNTNGTEYVIARFAETNYGEYFSVDYDPTNLLTLIDKGHFIIDSQKPGGNAAPGLTNRNLHIYSGGDEFDVQFGDTTYSQESASTNFDNDVGNYTYSLATTNIGQLNLSVLAPPVDASSNVLAGSASAARLLYLASNAGIFTNEDGTFSAFALTSVTNLAPDILTNTTVVFVENDFFGSTATINLADDGTFSYLTNSAGTYDYTRYSPSCGMLRLIESTNGVANNNPGGTDWVQLFFKSANGGTNYGNGSVELIGPTNDLKATISGTFSQH